MALTPYGLDVLRLGAISEKTVMLNFYSAPPSTTQEYTLLGNLELVILAQAYKFGWWEETAVSKESL